MDIDQIELLPIAIDGQAFKPNPDGLWNLNEIAKALGVTEPGQWRTSIRRALDQNANLHLAHGGANPGTWATEAGTIAYAMWVSPDFYLMVVHAFVAMRNDSIIRTRLALLAAAESDAKLAQAVPKAELVDRRLAANGIPWGEACRMAGVTKPQLAKQYLVYSGRFVCVEHPSEYRKILKPAPRGFAGGFFKACSLSYGNEDGFRVTASGLAWLQSKAQEINVAIADRARRKAVAKRK